jgi:hypothetical protein
MVRHSAKLTLCHCWLQIVHRAIRRQAASSSQSRDLALERRRAYTAMITESLSLLQEMRDMDTQQLCFAPGQSRFDALSNEPSLKRSCRLQTGSIFYSVSHLIAWPR